MKTITIWQTKGGVGKSTITFNLAATMAKKGFRVLCLDLDEQANLTSFFEKDLKKRKQSKPDIQRIIKENLNLKKGIYTTRFKNLKFVSGSNEVFLPLLRSQLKKLLEEIENEFDFCFIDTHPGSGIMQQEALAASDFVLLPIILDGFSRDNLNLVIKTFFDLENVTGKTVPQFALVVNRLRRLNSQLEVYCDLKENHDYPMLETSISECAAVNSALLAHKPLYLHRSKAVITKDFEELAQEVMSRVMNLNEEGDEIYAKAE